MKRMIQGLFVASFLLLLQAAPAQATIESIIGEVCTTCGRNTNQWG